MEENTFSLNNFELAKKGMANKERVLDQGVFLDFSTLIQILVQGKKSVLFHLGGAEAAAAAGGAGK